jgi:hypothetical protein
VTLDLAEVAYTAWADQMVAATKRLRDELGPDVEFSLPGAWAELDEVESQTWIAVEAEFQRAVDETPVGAPPVSFTLSSPVPGPAGRDGTPLKGKFPKTASTFDIRAATAADCLAAEKQEKAERDYRIACACMKPKDGGRWSWHELMKVDAADLEELRRLALTHGPRLDARLYEAYRAAELERFAVELVDKLHPADLPEFVALEEREGRRERVLAALATARESDEGADRERWEGEPCWPDMPGWNDVFLQGAPNRYIWMRIAEALASAGEGVRLRLFSPGLPRELVARSKMIARDTVEMLKGEVPEDGMLRLVASRCDVPREDLLRATIDDYERIFLFGARLQGNWEREMATKSSASKRG